MILRFDFLCVLIVTAGAAFAHHSAPVFYKVDERITVSGTVTEFRFNNPHAIPKFDVERKRRETAMDRRDHIAFDLAAPPTDYPSR
jgi:hypothetical protein